MKKNRGSGLIPDRIAYLVLVVLGYLFITLDHNILITMVVANLISAVVLMMNSDDYRNYGEQSYANKVWLQCLAISASGLILGLVVLLIGLAFRTFNL